LLGIAFGLPAAELGLGSLVVDPVPLLKARGLTCGEVQNASSPEVLR
jgi:hypothetical protein